MVDIKLRIEVNPDAETETLGDITNNLGEISNVSFKVNENGVYQAVSSPTSAVKGTNGLSLAKPLIFNEQGYLDNSDGKGAVLRDEEKPNEFVWGAVPENKEYHIKLTFSNANNLKDIIVYGDSVVGQFPTRAIVDGSKIIFSDGSRWAINLENESNTHTIEFTHWNRANYNACLTLISIMLRYYDIEKKDITDLSTLAQINSSSGEIEYGVLYGNGNVDLIDRDGELSELAEADIISNNNTPIEVYVNNQKIAQHISSDNSYSRNSKLLSMELTSKLEKLENMEFPYIKGYQKDMTLYSVIYLIIEKLGYSQDEYNDMLSDIILYGDDNKEDTIQSYLENIKLNMYYFKGKSYREVLEYCCEVAQLKLIDDPILTMRFVTARPRKTSNDDIIVIPARSQNQNSNIDIDLIVKNKFDKVLIKEGYEINDIFGFDDDIDESVVVTDSIQISNEHKAEIVGKYFINTYFIGNKYYKYCEFQVNAIDNYENCTEISLEQEPFYTININVNNKDYTFNGELRGYTNIVNYFNNYASDNIEAGYISSFQDNNLFNKKTTFFFVIPAECYIGLSSPTIIKVGYNGVGIKYRFGNFSQQSYGTGNLIKEINQENPLLLNTTKYDNKKMSNIIANNIINDYSNGIRNGNATLVCMDYYDEFGNKIKDWSKGDIIKVGDIVRFDKDNSGTPYFTYPDGTQLLSKITSCEFRFGGGISFIDVELEEVK
ncbi:MAG: hypothetical protein ACI4PF_01075 [Christensenellales bacterium]